jgi:hypothetical protein
MEWHINDLSICGQFRDSQSLTAALEPLVRLRITRPDLRPRIFCSKQLRLRTAIGATTLIGAISSLPDKNLKALAITWLANTGPFWDDDRAVNEDDLFYFQQIEVTDQGLGEAARRILLGTSAGTFSFLGAPEDICANPLLIVHGLPEIVLNEICVRNSTDLAEIALEPEPTPDSWTNMIEQVTGRLRELIFSEEIATQLQPSPFHGGVARRMIELLSILEEIAIHTGGDGSLDARGMELLQMHFVGEKASFTDESDDNKRDFKQQMTFDDPLNPEVSLFCPWHGKVKIGQFRIHFEWPRPKGQKQIKVQYMGPKITKR